MKLLMTFLFIFSLESSFAGVFQECRSGKCEEVIWIGPSEDYRVFDSTEDLEIGRCYKRVANDFTYFYQIKEIDGHYIRVTYERISKRDGFEYILYNERFPYQSSGLNFKPFPCEFTPKLWNKSYVANCLAVKNKKKNYCKRPTRAPKDFNKGRRK